MFKGRIRSVLLVDFDNLPSKLGEAQAKLVSNIAAWTAWLEDGGFDPARRPRRFLAKRVYWNGLFDVHRPAFEAAGFEAFACRAAGKGKASSADIVITLDAMESISEFRGLQEVVILSCDTDFVPVINRLQQKGVQTVAGGNETDASAAVYLDHADRVIRMEDFRRAMTYERPKRGWFGRRAAPPAPVAPTAPAPAPRPPPQRRAAPSRQARPSVDVAAGMDRLARAALRSGGAPISRRTVERVLADVRGFATTGAQPWLGFGSYRKMIEACAAERPELDVHRHANGGVSLVARADRGAGGPSPGA